MVPSVDDHPIEGDTPPHDGLGVSQLNLLPEYLRLELVVHSIRWKVRTNGD